MRQRTFSGRGQRYGGSAYAGRQDRIVAGPFVNIYNQQTLAALEALAVPLGDAGGAVARYAGGDAGTAAGFGRDRAVPLSVACLWHCRHAVSPPAPTSCPRTTASSAVSTTPTACCSTQDDARFLALNGIQTQSAQTYHLLHQLDDIRRPGVDVLRISPQSRHTPAIIQAFSDVLHSRLDAAQAHADISRYGAGRSPAMVIGPEGRGLLANRPAR